MTPSRSTERDPSAARTVVDRFAQHAARSPQAPALVCAGERLTYGELAGRAGRLAGVLAARGAGRESRVAVCLERRADLAVALLGVALAGAAYVPLDPAQPRRRLRLLVEDAAALCVVADPDTAPDLGVPAVAPDVAEDAPIPAAAPAVPAGRDALYVVYTSGSTGRPKAVVMEHGPTARLMRWAEGRYATGGRVLQYFPATADVCSYELFSTWWAGGCAVMADETERLDVAALADLIEREAVTTALLPTAVLARLAARHAAELAQVRELITTGDRLTLDENIRALAAGGPGREPKTLDNQWGSTEVNVVTTLRLERDPAAWPGTPSVGGPVSGGRIYVLDEDLRQVPLYVAGDLYVGGGQLARGYLGRPDLTAAAFLPDPFAADPGARMYRTGDRGHWRGDGTLEFLGRADRQLKIHGFRVEPGEVEAVLREHPAVDQAAVVPHRTGDEAARLVAYLVAAAGRELPDPDSLRSWLRRRLPDHMVPVAFTELDDLPATATGKVDRAALPAPRFAADPAAQARTETERAILAIWREVLGRPDLGVDDNFFSVGGYSLLVPQVVRRINEATGTRLPLRALFEAQTVRELAAREAR